MWVAQYVDESGNVRRVSTKTDNKEAANRILVKLENEVLQVRAGALTRTDIDVSKTRNDPIDKHLADFATFQKAKGVKQRQLDDDNTMLPRLFREAKIEKLTQITRSALDQWTVDSKEGRSSRKNENRGPRTINSHIDRLRCFCRWCVDERRLHSDPTAKIKDQNVDVDTRKQRRSLTTDEVAGLLKAAKTRKRNDGSALTGDETEMIYRTLLGTGLRSSELAALKNYQIEIEQRRIVLRAADVKNKKGVYHPITKELSDALAKWIKGKSLSDFVFKYNRRTLHNTFKIDCKAAGIERRGIDGRSIDVHSLRRTFGTMLARAGVPLTTTQRLMRHSTPELTAKLYIDVEPIDMLQAVEKLPTF